MCCTRFTVCFFTLLLVNAARADDSPSLSFEKDVRPILNAKCVKCHGKAKTRKSGDLDLNTPAGILKGGESGPVIVAGKPEKSLLYEKLRKGEMPPPETKIAVTMAEMETLRKWIADGAKMPAGSESALTQHDVIPIMLRHCTACHGRYKQESGLDLRTPATMLRGGKSGPALVRGKPAESLVIKRIAAGEMPPPKKLIEACVKPVEKSELDTLTKWIAAGAPVVNIQPDVATTTPDTLVTDKDRDFWAFRPPRPVKVPAVRDGTRVRNPIDAFVLQKLEAKGLTFAPEADRATLLRRAYYDLTGLPPEPSEVKAFLEDNSPDAYEKLIDRLLASARYGERWGRYWLDLAGYADSEGKREQDLPRPHAWRYRDYVIRAFNSDKPYDRFLLEQLAGDELADYASAKEISPQLYDNLVATGFLRMTPDATWANITGFIPDRIEVIADEIDVLGSAVLGLTMKCARCHSHKFDPIPHRDYYRLVAVFKGALDEYDWLKPEIRPGIGPESIDWAPPRLLPFVTTIERRLWEANNLELPSGRKREPEPKIQAVWDRGEPSPTYIYRRGDYLLPGALVGPGVPSVLTDGKTPFEVKSPWPGAKQTGRRLAFARWVTQPNHPLTARVMVNRIWRHHFGKGIVPTLANFGKAGIPPTHPELLDWLATELANPDRKVGGDVKPWSLKRMHRLIMTSTTYRQSSAITPQAKKLDPANALYSRMPMVRLDAEALYDSLLLVAGKLDERRGGPADVVQARKDGLITPTGTAKGWRRLIYVQQTRKQLPTHAETFDFPQLNPNCVERRDSTVAPQALYLMNNGMVEQLAAEFAKRVRREAGGYPARQVNAVYLIALSRLPTTEEKKLGIEALEKLADEWEKQLTATGKPDRDSAELKALATYCHAILNSAAFLYVD
ncbi:MAG: PSD1 and planctomycete cytochrome C domain-containing protein [Planctomycetia bacterium]|nr:PSD1 and planctomycete cytochrome C domain-containing protein [Planctomycetia bacterium]